MPLKKKIVDVMYESHAWDGRPTGSQPVLIATRHILMYLILRSV